LQISSRRIRNIAILSLAGILVVSIFAVPGLSVIPPVAAISVQPFHLNNNFNYSLTPCETFTTHGPPPTGPCSTTVGASQNETACTNNFRVNVINITWVAPDGTTSVTKFTVSGMKGQYTCVSSVMTLSQVGNYTVTAKFFAKNPLPCCPHEDIKGISRAVISTHTFIPEFPIGALMAVLAPLAALVGYVKFVRKPSF
jgi:hypothetical protein